MSNRIQRSPLAMRGLVQARSAKVGARWVQSAVAWRSWTRVFRFFAAVLCFPVACGLQPGLAQYIQQGPKLVGSGSSFSANQGQSVALSADGNTAIIGGEADEPNGAAWVFVRSGGVWTQQGPKLVGSGVSVGSSQGVSVALSADGNTAIVGGFEDNLGIGAAWVFIRDSGVWVQDGPKLVASDAVGAANLGYSVALSADGNTAIAGGRGDNSEVGAAWVFTRVAGMWTQQGSKLVGSGYVGAAKQGSSVALSADGNTALIGAIGDNGFAGAAWVFTRSGSTWTQQATKLFGSGATATAEQGYSVALSGDGNTAIVGGPFDSSNAGAMWVFTRNSGVWPQQGPKLVGSGAVGVGGSTHGFSVALSSDGNTLVGGGPFDNSETGAAWIFTRSSGVWTQRGAKLVGTGAGQDASPCGGSRQGAAVAISGDHRTVMLGGVCDTFNIGAAWPFVSVGAHDFNADGVSDVAWRNAEGDTAVWLLSGAQVTPGPAYGPISNTWSIVGQRDFNGDGMADMLWRDTSGNTAMWFMNETTIASSATVGNIATNWSVAGVADFNGDGLGDILWRDSSGNLSIWLMSGATVISSAGLGSAPMTWTIVGTGDFNGDGMADILWRDNLGNTSIWFMSGTTVASTAGVGNIPNNWSVVGTGDFNGDGKCDIVWRDSAGDVAIWLMNGASVVGTGGLGNLAAVWSLAETGDFDGNGTSDLLWRDTSGDTAIWFLNGAQVMSAVSLGSVSTNWTIQGVNAD
jgi:FG-GAP-like repeat/FG-GAP repeat